LNAAPIEAIPVAVAIPLALILWVAYFAIAYRRNR
jgi:hypothetical protein